MGSRIVREEYARCTMSYVLWLYGISGFFLFLGGIAYVLLKFSGSIRNLVGLQKDRLDIKKARREDEKAGSLIQEATLTDVSKYDPKVRRIERIARLLLIIVLGVASSAITFTSYVPLWSRLRYWVHEHTWDAVLTGAVLAAALLALGANMAILSLRRK